MDSFLMRIALAQINPTVGDLTGNQQKILHYVERAKVRKADLVVFPELVICGYPPEDLLYKDHFIEDNMKILGELAASISGITAVIGFVDQDKNKNLFNAAAVIRNGKIKYVYHKRELPNYGVFDEKRYFQLGKKNGRFSLRGCKLGLSICEDIWVQQNALKGKGEISIHINISSSPYDIGKLQEREKILISRAKQQKAFVCYVNLVGGQDELVFDGGSLIVDPKGRVVASGKAFEEDLIIADLSDKRTPRQQTVRCLSQIERVYKALVLGTRDYIGKNGFKKVVLGLSGGIDSSLVAAIAVDAIGSDNVIGVSMPSRYSSKGTQGDARRLARSLGIEFKEIPIEDVFKAYHKTLSGEFEGHAVGVAEENIQARIRGNILMALSNKFGWMVLTTGNKSEVAVGYCTLYGDMSGGFAVIKDVPKMMVYALSRFRNARAKKEGKKDLIPVTILKRAPSAELRANQKDQDSLPPYEVLDEILKAYVEDHGSVKNIVRGQKRDVVEHIIKLIDRSEYKRRQAPPGIKITPRAFGRDWRLPITNKYREVNF